jgi:phage terminase small subunit
VFFAKIGASDMKGRKPLPTAVKLAKGTERKSRINGNEPSLPKMPLEPPGYLSGDALAFWSEHAKALIDAGVLRVSDRHAFGLLCESFAAWRAEPTRDTIAEFRRMLSEFGMTPAARTKVKVESKPKDALTEFLGKKKA